MRGTEVEAAGVQVRRRVLRDHLFGICVLRPPPELARLCRLGRPLALARGSFAVHVRVAALELELARRLARRRDRSVLDGNGGDFEGFFFLVFFSVSCVAEFGLWRVPTYSSTMCVIIEHERVSSPFDLYLTTNSDQKPVEEFSTRRRERARRATRRASPRVGPRRRAAAASSASP